MEWKELAVKINKALVKAKNQGIKADTILVGEKEMEVVLRDTSDLDDYDFGDDFDFRKGNIWTIDIIKVDKESFFKVVYTIDIEGK